jgi:hypothetical protein
MLRENLFCLSVQVPGHSIQRVLPEEVLHLCSLRLFVEVACDALDKIGEQSAAGVLAGQQLKVLFEEGPCCG